MISVSNVTVRYSGEILFNDISFMINAGDRIGLIGKNGAGKSTLLKLISGRQRPTSGTVASSGETRVGHLDQDIELPEGKTVFEEAETAFEELQEMEARLYELRDFMTREAGRDDAEYMKLVQEAGDLEERFAMMDGYSAQANIQKVLLGLGFRENDLDQPTNTFSGGWRMRIELAKILLREPDVLLLDEPTNHLDIESIIWLEEWLKAFGGGLVIVSHDRRFLDSVTNRTIEVVRGRVHDHRVPYSKFVQLRQERRENQQRAKENQDKEIRRIEGLIEKFKGKPNKASFVENLKKRLDRMESVEVDEEDTSRVHFRFPPAPRSGKVPLAVEHVSKSYGEKEVLRDVSFRMDRGDRVAFVGKNGKGKTTLAKIIAGVLDHEGEVKKGHNVSMGYYAQDQSDQLDPSLTVQQTAEREAPSEGETRIRNVLGSFLFTGEDVHKPVKVLSGGERSRLALCKLLLNPVNFLVMDEPTNHLDMTSKDILKNALLQYDGTLIVVSHDRDFLQGLTDKVYEFSDQGVREYIGDLQYFLDKREMSDLEDLDRGGQKKALKKGDEKGEQEEYEKNNGTSDGKKLDPRERKELNKKIRKCSKTIRDLEARIDEQEKVVKEMEGELMDPEKAQDLSVDDGIFEDHRRKKSRLDELMEQWEQETSRYEALQEEWKEKFGD